VKLIFSEVSPQLQREFTIAKENDLPLDYVEAIDVDHDLEICELEIIDMHKDEVTSCPDENMRNLFPNLSKNKDFWFIRKPGLI
jgi:Ca2+-binding EF-hand superfamily protein